jgi:hypothetical protein
MKRPPVSTLIAVLVVVAFGVTIGCTGGDTPASGDTVEPQTQVPSVTIPAERLTPFCQAMIDLSDRLETDPPDDATALIVSVYEDISDEVPVEILDDFDAVLTALRDGSAASVPVAVTSDAPSPSTPDEGPSPVATGDEFFDEGYSPDEDPATRLNDYVDFACRDSVNNPGPPATQPLEDIAPTTLPG